MTGYTIRVPISDCGAAMTIPYPYGDPHIEWMMRYGNMTRPFHNSCLVAAEVISSFDYLLSSNINMTEATRRLRLMRAARRNAVNDYVETAPPQIQKETP